jgi:hypothetical protein
MNYSETRSYHVNKSFIIHNCGRFCGNFCQYKDNFMSTLACSNRTQLLKFKIRFKKDNKGQLNFYFVYQRIWSHFLYLSFNKPASDSCNQAKNLTKTNDTCITTLSAAHLCTGLRVFIVMLNVDMLSFVASVIRCSLKSFG